MPSARPAQVAQALARTDRFGRDCHRLGKRKEPFIWPEAWASASIGFIREQHMQEYLTHFGLVEVSDPRALSNEQMVYAVVQGPDVITVGWSKGRQRLRSLMGADSLHFKKALVSLCARERPQTPIRFYCRLTPEAKDLETKMHAELGALHGLPSTSTCIDGIAGYSNALRHLLGDTARFSEREKDLIELVLANGDIYCSLLRLERFRESAIAIFGDYYTQPRPAARQSTPAQRVAAMKAQPSIRAEVTAPVTPPMGTATGRWHEVTERYWKFRQRDWEALQRPNCLGFRLIIRGPVGQRWIDGEVVIEVPKDTNDAGWRHLSYLATLSSFRDTRENTSSRNVPHELRGNMHRLGRV